MVDLGGRRGSTRASVRVLPGALPELRTTRARPAGASPTSPTNVASLVEHPEDVELLDVFISHASEDKDAVARPLAEALDARG